MKSLKYRYILILGVFLVFGSLPLRGQSATIEYHKQIDPNLDPMQSDGQLSVVSLNGFEHRSEQKLKDFINYISIVSDSKYDSKLRKHAADLATRLFVKSENTIESNLWGKSKSYKVDAFFEKLLESNSKFELKLEAVELAEKLAQNRNYQYHGILHYSQKCANCTPSTTKMQTEIIVKPVKKQFGIRMEEVWEVRLGNVKLR